MYERRQIRLGEGNMFLVWSCSSRMFFFLSGRRVQSEVFAGSSLECRLNLEVLGHLHRAWSPHVNLLRAVTTSTYDILFLGGMSWSGLLASYAVSMVLKKTNSRCTSYKNLPTHDTHGVSRVPQRTKNVANRHFSDFRISARKCIFRRSYIKKCCTGPGI